MTDSPPLFAFFNEIGIIDQLAGTLFEGVMPRGMTLAQFSVLNHFARLGLEEKSPADLARAFQVTRPTMTSTLQRMERSGLVRLAPDPNDGRGKRVSITDKGKAMRDDCIRAIEPLYPMLSGIISDEEITATLPMLARIRAALDAARQDRSNRD